MNDGLTPRQVDAIFGNLKEINDRLGRIEQNQTAHQTTLGASVERAAEDRARIKILEDSRVKSAERMSRIEDRQKVGAVLLGGLQFVLASLAAWIGMTR